MCEAVFLGLLGIASKRRELREDIEPFMFNGSLLVRLLEKDSATIPRSSVMNYDLENTLFTSETNQSSEKVFIICEWISAVELYQVRLL
jgi:hypothetical protein